jgi:hypothetical protein
LGAVRRVTFEAGDSGLISPELTAGIRRVKEVRRIGVRVENWLSEHGRRPAERLDPLIGEIGRLREFWGKIPYDYRDSELIRFPLAGFDVEKWEEVHKQLLRLFFWTSLHVDRALSCFPGVGIKQQPRLAQVMSNQHEGRSADHP